MYFCKQANLTDGRNPNYNNRVHICLHKNDGLLRTKQANKIIIKAYKLNKLINCNAQFFNTGSHFSKYGFETFKLKRGRDILESCRRNL